MRKWKLDETSKTIEVMTTLKKEVAKGHTMKLKESRVLTYEAFEKLANDIATAKKQTESNIKGVMEQLKLFKSTLKEHEEDIRHINEILPKIKTEEENKDVG